MVKNLPCNAGDMGLIPGWGTKMPHAMACVPQLDSPCSATRILHAAAETQCSQINKSFKKDFNLVLFYGH